MDPSESWYHRTFFDGGEFGHSMGLASSPMQRGTDCPDNASYIDVVVADTHGMPQRRPDVACLFERTAGNLLWRHREYDLLDSRSARSLVVRWTATLGNYDYVFDWISSRMVPFVAR